MSYSLMNYNDATFPNPHAFIPTRWISDDAAYLRKLDEVTAPFSKGSRSCIGRKLALAEIIARRFKPV
jgi:cytochrome P450